MANTAEHFVWQKYYPNYDVNYDANDPKSFYKDADPVVLALLEPFLRQVPNGATILDLAAGDGRYTFALLDLFKDKGKSVKIIATDIEQKPLEILTEKAKKRGYQNSITAIPNFNAFDKFPIKDGKLNAVVCTGFLYLFPPEHIKDIVTETHRILADGGLFVFDFVTNKTRTDLSGNPKNGDKEMNYTLREGLSTLDSILQPTVASSLFTQNIFINKLDVLMDGVLIRGDKINVLASKIKSPENTTARTNARTARR